MKIYQRFLSGHTSGKCHLNLMFSNKLKNLIFLVRKISIIIFFNNLPINSKSTQKNLDLLLDEKLNFLEHISEKLKKATKSINQLRMLNLTLPRSFLLIIINHLLDLS